MKPRKTTKDPKRIVVWMAAAVALFLTSPLEGYAQTHIGISVDWWDWIRDVRVHGSVEYGHPRSGPVYRDHGYVHPPVVDRYRPIRTAPRARRGRGPAFCRSGEGHPVHGWSWCVRKGFVRPHVYRDLPPRVAPRRRPVVCCTWHPVDLGPVHFRGDPYRRMDRSLGHGELLRLLGRGVIDDLYARVEYRREVPLEARWHPSTGEARVLQVRAGSTPVAELTDLDRDRRVDRVLLARAGVEDR